MRRIALLFVLALLATVLAVVPVAQAQPVVTIMQIQGPNHLSPLDGDFVTSSGVVTAVGFQNYFVQDPTGDGNPNTSDGLFIFTFGAQPAVGDLIEFTGTVEERVPGGAATGNLSTTQMFQPSFRVISSGNALPAPVVIGSSGLIPPNVVTISEATTTGEVNLQTDTTTFNPAVDGIDFYEALENMRVTIEDPVAVSGTRSFGPFSSEFWTLPNNGAHVAPADVRTARGGINLAADADGYGDTNPERVRVQIVPDYYPFPLPQVVVGQRMGDVTGVVGYNFGNFEVNATEEITLRNRNLRTEQTGLRPTGSKVAVASYNVLNLSPQSSDDVQRGLLADQIVTDLKSPDVIALQEIQDNSGTTDNGVVDANQTLDALVEAIEDAGGPSYEWFQVNPVNGSSGGVPGGNIRNAFFWNPDRVERVDGLSLTQSVLNGAGIVGDPFNGTRNPLQATFEFRGTEFTVISNHLSSRFGSSPIFGGPQLFIQAAETGAASRESQTQALNDWVDGLLDGDSDAHVMVVGDFNTFEFTDDLTEILPGIGSDRILENLTDLLRDDNNYTFIFDGNSQVLDHFFVTEGLEDDARAKYDIVHVNVDYPRNGVVASDHEPVVGQFNFARLNNK